MATKPTKQQVAQAKARAGGNNPVKVTNAGLKKLGSAAVIAASFTPAGRVARGAVTVAKAASGARKASTAAKSSRQAGDYVISKESPKRVMTKAGSGGGNYRFGRDTEITKNVSIKDTKSPSGKVSITGGAAQAMRQEMRLSQPVSKAEAKGNARGLKAANKPTNKIGSKADKEIRSRTKSVSTSKEETKAIYDYRYGKGAGKDITQINKRVTPKNEAMSVRKSPVKLTKKTK